MNVYVWLGGAVVIVNGDMSTTNWRQWPTATGVGAEERGEGLISICHCSISFRGTTKGRGRRGWWPILLTQFSVPRFSGVSFLLRSTRLLIGMNIIIKLRRLSICFLLKIISWPPISTEISLLCWGNLVAPLRRPLGSLPRLSSLECSFCLVRISHGLRLWASLVPSPLRPTRVRGLRDLWRRRILRVWRSGERPTGDRRSRVILDDN